jgi:NadR type nicotinamide-nucleotide adenylyltransferase
MIRISVTGPESTGKSWLAERLASRYSSPWVPEYAREYLETLRRPYTYDDILQIARTQYEREKAACSSGMVFCDTDFLVTAIWCQVKYGRCHPWITRMLESEPYDLYLLCNIDLPWEYDPLREHPEMRADLFTLYRNRLDALGFNYRVVSGTGAERLRNAADFVDEILDKR